MARKKQEVEDVATVMLATTRPIVRIEQVQSSVSEQFGLEVTRSLTR